MKKIYFVLLSLALVFCLGGCQLLGRRTTTEEPTTVVTKGAPTINGAHDVELELNERYIPMAGISAVDADGNDITDDVVYTGDVDYTKVGEYHATFTVTDSNGKTTSVTITVRVVSSDKEAPALSGVADIEIPVTSDFDPMQGVSAIDTTDGDLTDKVQVEGKVDTKNLGTQTLKYSVVDNAGNKAELNRVVKVTEGRFVFEEEAASSENKVTCDPLDLEGVYTFVLIKVKYSVAEAGDVTVALGDYSVSHHHDAAGEFITYVRADEALTDQAISLTGATFVSLWIGSCPDVTAPTITGNFSQTFVISKDNRDLAAQFVADMSEAVARDDTDGFITKDCYMEFPEGFSWDSTDEQDAFFCAKDKAGNVARKEVKVIVAAATKIADMLPVGEGPDSGHDNNPQILMYRNMTMTKQDDGSILLSEMTSGGYASHQMIKYDLSNLSYGNTYMLKLTAKFLPGESTQETQAVGYRIGQSLGGDPWYAEFSGFSYDYFNLTPELTTTYHVFKYDMTPEAASAFGDVSGEAMEFQFGNTTYYTIYDVVLVSFELYILSNENQAPTLIRNTELPTILVKDSEAPDLTKYFSYFDVEDKDLQIVIEGSVDMSAKGLYPVKFTVTDSEGLKAEATLTFEVLNEADTIAPEIKWESPAPEQLPALPEEIEIDAYSTDAVKNFFLQGLKITDKKDGATIEMAVKDASINWGGLNMSAAGKYKIVVTIKDDSGNEGKFEHTIKVVKPGAQGGSWVQVSDYMTQQTFTQENVAAAFNEGVFEIQPTTFEGGGWASFNKSKMELLAQFEVGKTYKLVVEAKADVARTIALNFACAGGGWSKYGSVGKITAALGTDWEQFEVEFTYTGKFTSGTDELDIEYTALEIQLGNINWDAGESLDNKVYIRKMELLEKNEGELVADYMKQSTFTQEAVVAEFKDGVFEIQPTGSVGGWASANKSKMELLSPFEVGRTYKLVVEAKADAARTIALSFASADTSWNNYGTVGKVEAALGTDWEQFEAEFTYTGKFEKDGVEYAIGYTALEIQLGNINWDAGESVDNKVYIRKMEVYLLPLTEELVADYMSQETFTQENVAAAFNEGVFEIQPTTFENGGWASFNKSKMELLSPFEVGRTYKLVVEAKADVARTIALNFACAGGGWSKYGSVGKVEAALGTDWEQFEVEFTYTGKFTSGTDELDIEYTALEIQLGNINWDAGESLDNKVYIRKMEVYELLDGIQPKPEQPEQPESSKYDVLDKGTAYSDNNQVTMTKNDDGTYTIPTIKEKWFGWKNLSVPAKAKYCIIKVQTTSCTIRYKVDDANNSMDSKKTTKLIEGTDTIIIDLSTFTSDPSKLVKVVLWGTTEGNPEIKVLEAYFIDELPDEFKPVRYDVLDKGTAYSDNNQVTMTKNDDGTYTIPTIKEKWFGWKNLSVPAKAKYCIIKVQTTSCTIRYKVDDANNSMDSKKTTKLIEGTDTIIIDLSTFTSDPSKLVKVVLWGTTEGNPEIKVLEALFLDELPEELQQPQQQEEQAAEYVFTLTNAISSRNVIGVRLSKDGATKDVAGALDGLKIKVTAPDGYTSAMIAVLTPGSTAIAEDLSNVVAASQALTISEHAAAWNNALNYSGTQMLKLDFEDGTDQTKYNNSLWKQEQYTTAWEAMSDQMNCRTKGSKVVNCVAGGYTTRYTFESQIGKVDYFSIKLGNYFNGAAPIKAKISLIKADGSVIYLFGADGDNWEVIPVTTGLITYEKEFAEADIKGIRIALKNVSGNAYLYMDDITLKTKNAPQMKYAATIQEKEVAIEINAGTTNGFLKAPELGLEVAVSVVMGQDGSVTTKDIATNGALITCVGSINQTFTVVHIDTVTGSYQYGAALANQDYTLVRE